MGIWEVLKGLCGSGGVRMCPGVSAAMLGNAEPPPPPRIFVFYPGVLHEQALHDSPVSTCTRAGA